VEKIGILYHPVRQAAQELAEQLREFLASRGVSAWVCSAWEGEQAREQLPGTDLILSVGGDGTVLRSAQVVIPEEIAITGVNLGDLGFLTELRVDRVRDELAALLAGRGWVDERALLEAEVSLPEGGTKQVFYALNDVVVARGGIARLVRIEAIVDGESLTTYRADGVIVATATGSTGYSLSAGGPILHPQARELLLLPVAPHLSLPYPLVLSSAAQVELRLNTYHQAMMSIDGHINLPLPDGAVITVRCSPHTVRFLRLNPAGYFYSSLASRLQGR